MRKDTAGLMRPNSALEPTVLRAVDILVAGLPKSRKPLRHSEFDALGRIAGSRPST